jgi:hypothetical protein
MQQEHEPQFGQIMVSERRSAPWGIVTDLRVTAAAVFPAQSVVHFFDSRAHADFAGDGNPPATVMVGS